MTRDEMTAWNAAQEFGARQTLALTDTANELRGVKHQRDELLGAAHKLLVALGIANADVPMDGPMALMVLDEAAKQLPAQLAALEPFQRAAARLRHFNPDIDAQGVHEPLYAIDEHNCSTELYARSSDMEDGAQDELLTITHLLATLPPESSL